MERVPPLSEQEKLEAVELIRAAEKSSDRALKYLLDCLAESEVASRVYARRDRVKSLTDIEDKVARKRRKKPAYAWTDITDIGGLRFITLYRDDIAPVTEVVLRALLGEPSDRMSPFVRDDVHEFRFYLANAHLDSDPLAIKLAGIADKWCGDGDAFAYEPFENDRYSSVHFVARVRSDRRASSLKAPLEIQIRSVFEDAWGEVDHSLLYRHRRMDIPLEGVFAQIERHSNALKKMMDAAADFADAMRSLGAPEKPPASRMRPTLDGAGYVSEVLKLIDAPDAVVDQVMDLVERKSRLDAAIESREVWVNRLEYVRLAGEFGELLSTHVKAGGFLHDIAQGAKQREFVYILRMEEAVCRLLANEERQVPIAVLRLSELAAEFPDHPVMWFRLGEAYERQLEVLPTGDALEEVTGVGAVAYEKAALAIAGLAKKTGAARTFAASQRQEDFIRNNLARMHAFFVWRSEGKRRGGAAPNAASLEAVRGAFSLTFYAISTVREPEPRRRLLNGLVYFAAEAMQLARLLGEDEALEASPKDLRKFVEELEEKVRPEEDGIERLRLWDTIAFAWLALGEQEFARTAAIQVLDVLNSNILAHSPQALAPYIQEQQGLAMRRALSILGIGQPGGLPTRLYEG